MTDGAPELDPGGLRHAEVDGLRTRYYEAGDPAAPALLLVHGGQYGSWYALDSWDTVLAPLAERFRVVALDRPGQGHTQAPRAPDGAGRRARATSRASSTTWSAGRRISSATRAGRCWWRDSRCVGPIWCAR